MNTANLLLKETPHKTWLGLAARLVTFLAHIIKSGATGLNKYHYKNLSKSLAIFEATAAASLFELALNQPQRLAAENKANAPARAKPEASKVKRKPAGPGSMTLGAEINKLIREQTNHAKRLPPTGLGVCASTQSKPLTDQRRFHKLMTRAGALQRAILNPERLAKQLARRLGRAQAQNVTQDFLGLDAARFKATFTDMLEKQSESGDPPEDLPACKEGNPGAQARNQPELPPSPDDP